ncbi:MAG TPA: hypothetical protein VGJ20_30305 [Xanthobacteraceae bacterium]|jgi:hypothetical protein
MTNAERQARRRAKKAADKHDHDHPGMPDFGIKPAAQYWPTHLPWNPDVPCNAEQTELLDRLDWWLENGDFEQVMKWIADRLSARRDRSLTGAELMKHWIAEDADLAAYMDEQAAPQLNPEEEAALVATFRTGYEKIENIHRRWVANMDELVASIAAARKESKSDEEFHRFLDIIRDDGVTYDRATLIALAEDPQQAHAVFWETKTCSWQTVAAEMARRHKA